MEMQAAASRVEAVVVSIADMLGCRLRRYGGQWPAFSRRIFAVDYAIRIAQKTDLRSEGRMSAVAVPHVAEVIGDTGMSQQS